MTINSKGQCKHGEFDLSKGCPQCIAERRDDNGLLGDLAQSLANKTGKPIAVEPAGIHAEPEVTEKEERIPVEQRALVKVDPLADMVIGSLVIEAEKILAYAKDRQVTTLDEAKIANNDLTIISGIKKRMEEKRKEYLAPINTIKDQLSQTFNEIMGPILEAGEITKRKMLDFDREQKRIQAEQEEINRKRIEAAEAEMRLKGELTESVNLVEVTEVSKNVSTDMGTSTVRANWKWRVINPLAIPREYLIEDGVMLTSIAKKHHDAKQVPGIEFYNEPIISNRAR